MRTVVLATAFVFCAIVLSGGVLAAEEKVALDKVPKAVMEGVKKRFPKAKVTEAAKETADGKTVYEVTFKEGDK